MMPETGARCKCMTKNCLQCALDFKDYFATAQYLVQKYESVKGWCVYISPHTNRHKEYGVSDDLELLIKRGKKSKQLLKLLKIVGDMNEV